MYDHLVRAYVEHFGLKDVFRCGQAVDSVAEEGKAGWTVRTRQGLCVRAPRLVVATGVNHCPYMPADQMYERFAGPRLHVHDYNQEVRAMCTGRRVLIVGGSDHASDVASQLSHHASEIHVSIRNGQWFQDRMLGGETPADMFYNRTVDWWVKHVIGKSRIHGMLHGAGPSAPTPPLTYNVRLFWGRGGSDIPAWQPKCKYLNQGNARPLPATPTTTRAAFMDPRRAQRVHVG